MARATRLMSPNLFKAPRGTFDILPEKQQQWRFIRSTVEETARRFGYEQIDTPLFEDAGLFMRGVGESTDVVEKETYTFEDRGGNLVTLRPEGTAPVCRAYLENGLHNLSQPIRLYYFCPVFRFERPQSGRYRQHHQFGVEVLGDGKPLVDTEVIEFAWRLLEELGIQEKSLKINTTGDRECRPQYVNLLKSYYSTLHQELCEDCNRRFDQNPLRLLDCKSATCQPIIAGAPHSTDFLCAACDEHWNELLSNLGNAGISFELDHTLVRGFDYYTRTVFEIVPPSEGRQSTILGGGRYDGLIEELGGQPTPGIGFGMGIERVLANITWEDSLSRDPVAKILVASLGPRAAVVGMGLSSELRNNGVAALMGPSDRSLKSQLRYASSINATHVAIIGDEELDAGIATLRNLQESDQIKIGLKELPNLFSHNNT